jgi:hypothetical protein
MASNKRGITFRKPGDWNTDMQIDSGFSIDKFDVPNPD